MSSATIEPMVLNDHHLITMTLISPCWDTQHQGKICNSSITIATLEKVHNRSLAQDTLDALMKAPMNLKEKLGKQIVHDDAEALL